VTAADFKIHFMLLVNQKRDIQCTIITSKRNVRLQKLHTQYIRDFSRDDCARNMSVERPTMQRGLTCPKILPFRELPPSPTGLSWLRNVLERLKFSKLIVTGEAL